MSDIIELLRATKGEVDKRWARDVQLWGFGDDDKDKSCILGCLGFARFGEDFFVEGSTYKAQNDKYPQLRDDELTGPTIDALAKHSKLVNHANPLESVYRHNDTYLETKQAAKDFIDLAIADLQTP